MKTDNMGTGFFGVRIDGDPVDESEHFYKCSKCGQAVDMRDLGQVFHHEEADHKPLELNS
jgi:hypothetical protein